MTGWLSIKELKELAQLIWLIGMTMRPTVDDCYGFDIR